MNIARPLTLSDFNKFDIRPIIFITSQDREETLVGSKQGGQQNWGRVYVYESV